MDAPVKQEDAPVKQEDFDRMKSNVECMQKKILAVKLANTIINQHISPIMELQECFDSIPERLDCIHRTARQQGGEHEGELMILWITHTLP